MQNNEYSYSLYTQIRGHFIFDPRSKIHGQYNVFMDKITKWIFRSHFFELGAIF